MPATLLDDAHDFGSGLFYVGKLAASGIGCAAALLVELVGFLRIGAHGFLCHFRAHHALAQAVQHAGFQSGTGDGASIIAAIAENVVGAGIAVLPTTATGAAATRAKHEAGQEGTRAMGGVEIAIPGFHVLGGGAGSLDPVLVERGLAG